MYLKIILAQALRMESLGGADRILLDLANIGLIKPDLEILLDGARFTEAKEIGHTHEDNSSHMDDARQAHLNLADEFGWYIVNANQTKEEVHEEIWGIVSNELAL